MEVLVVVLLELLGYYYLRLKALDHCFVLLGDLFARLFFLLFRILLILLFRILLILLFRYFHVHELLLVIGHELAWHVITQIVHHFASGLHIPDILELNGYLPYIGPQAGKTGHKLHMQIVI